jgi:hypothetical protein
MTLARLTALAGLAAAATAFRAQAYEMNAWPVFVAQRDDSGRNVSWSGAGPFLYSGQAPAPDLGTVEGFRPFYEKVSTGGVVKTDILYPVFFFRRYPDAYKWSIFQLVNGEGTDASAREAGLPTDRHFDVWPFYFSHKAPDPADSYSGLLPVYGTIKNRIGYNRISWVMFPVYASSLRKGTETTYTPWPIVRVMHGDWNGVAVWPLFGEKKGPGRARQTYFLWPLVWSNVVEPTPDDPPGSGPGSEFGILPFYSRERYPGSTSENYFWPFFGYTEDWAPYHYSERRYFWPFLVQGRGESRVVERWGPIYTHSCIKGTDNRWIVWPLWHRTTWADSDTAQSRTQFFYFVYWSLYQTSVSRPALAPAYKRHIWPLATIWDNGAGSRQVQVPSLTEVFFPDNPDIRENWSPLLAAYRYDHRPNGEARTALLWGAVTWRTDDARGLQEFHVGPLLGMRRRPAGSAWTILGFDFSAKVASGKEANH